MEILKKITQEDMQDQIESSDEEGEDNFSIYYNQKMKDLDDNNLFRILKISKEFVLFISNWYQ